MPKGTPHSLTLRNVGKISKGYTGKATATYPNGEIYEGDYVEGVFKHSHFVD
jgi:hypothetical protein